MKLEMQPENLDDEAEEFWRNFEEIRSIKNSHILRKVMVLR
jgi:hypothetical protein